MHWWIHILFIPSEFQSFATGRINNISYGKGWMTGWQKIEPHGIFRSKPFHSATFTGLAIAYTTACTIFEFDVCMFTDSTSRQVTVGVIAFLVALILGYAWRFNRTPSLDDLLDGVPVHADMAEHSLEFNVPQVYKAWSLYTAAYVVTSEKRSDALATDKIFILRCPSWPKFSNVRQFRQTQFLVDVSRLWIFTKLILWNRRQECLDVAHASQMNEMNQ